MKKKPTNIKLHGVLGDSVGGRSWDLVVGSVGEAIRAIEVLSKRKLYKFLQEKDSEGLMYKVLINGRTVDTSKIKIDDIDTIKSSELNMNFNNLETIDIVPVIEGAGKSGSIGAIVLGAVLIVVGAILVATGVGAGIGGALIVAGLGLITAGVINLISSPPKFEDFREIKNGGRSSYLFSGPQNTVREGGPVPVGYGRLIVGSQVLSASYEISHVDADTNPLTS